MDGFERVALSQRLESNKAFFSGWAQNWILAAKIDFISFAFQCRKKLPPCKALLDSIVHILPDGCTPCRLAVLLSHPLGVGLCHMSGVFGVDNRQLIFLAKFIRDCPNFRHIASIIAVVHLAVNLTDGIPDDVGVDMSSI